MVVNKLTVDDELVRRTGLVLNPTKEGVAEAEAEGVGAGVAVDVAGDGVGTALSTDEEQPKSNGMQTAERGTDPKNDPPFMTLPLESG